MSQNLLLHYVGFKVRCNRLGKLLGIFSIPPSHLETPLVTDLSIKIQVHFYHQQPVPSPGEARSTAAIGSSHVTRSIKVSEVMMGCKTPINVISNWE